MTSKDIEEVLRRHKLTGPYAQDDYVMAMETMHKPYGGKFMDQVDKGLRLGFTATRWRRLYAAKNVTTSLSLYVSSHSYTATHRVVLKWLMASVGSIPDRWTELGCENGLLSMCIADLWPESVGHGIDRVPQAIAVARQLAVKFGHQGLTFSMADLEKKDSVGSVNPAQLVLAPFVFHEMLDGLNGNHEVAACNVAALLAPGGSVVSFNRFPHRQIGIRRLAAFLQDGGLSVVGEDEVEVGAEKFAVVRAAKHVVPEAAAHSQKG